MDFVPPFCIMVFGKEYFVSRQKKEFEEYEINESVGGRICEVKRKESATEIRII